MSNGECARSGIRQNSGILANSATPHSTVDEALGCPRCSVGTVASPGRVVAAPGHSRPAARGDAIVANACDGRTAAAVNHATAGWSNARPGTAGEGEAARPAKAVANNRACLHGKFHGESPFSLDHQEFQVDEVRDCAKITWSIFPQHQWHWRLAGAGIRTAETPASLVTCHCH